MKSEKKIKRRVGIVGLGNAGSAIAQALLEFVNVEGFDRVSLSSFPEDGISYTFCTVKERTDFTDFDSCIFDDYYGYVL